MYLHGGVARVSSLRRSVLLQRNIEGGWTRTASRVTGHRHDMSRDEDATDLGGGAIEAEWRKEIKGPTAVTEVSGARESEWCSRRVDQERAGLVDGSR